jgi:WD40 repeat protein
MLLVAAAAFTVVRARADDAPDRVEVKLRELPQIKHGNGFRSMAISRDGKLLLTASEDHTARLWDTATGKPVGQPFQHDAMVKEAVISADGKVVATAGGEGIARLWEAQTGKPIGKVMRHNNSVNAVALSPDGKYVLTGGQDAVARLWDAATGEPVGPVLQHPQSVSHVAFMPDGRTVLTACADRAVRKWDVASGQQLGLACSEPVGVTSLDFSRDGRLLITCSRDVGVRLWETVSGKPLSVPVAPERHFGDIAFSPDASVFLTSSTAKSARPETTQAVQFWDTETLRPIGKPFRDKNGLAFDPTGKIIAVGGDDGVVEIWEVCIRPAKSAAAKSPPGKPESPDALWTALAGEDAVEAVRAVSAFGRIPGAAVPFLEKHLKPATGADDKAVRKLIAELDDESFDVRENAERRLVAIRRSCETQLRAALAKDPPMEVRQRLQRVLEAPTETGPDPEQVRTLRALQVLESIGTAEAQRLLRTLAEGAPDADLTRAARAALDRLAKR